MIQFFKLVILVSLIFIACQNNSNSDKATDNKSSTTTSQKTDIPFTLAKNYFVKNTFEKLDNPKIETHEQFNEIFGMATTMAKDGKPTEIDFAKQYVIAVILPNTDSITSLAPISLQKDEKGTIILKYKKEVGEKQTFTIRPSFEIIVDKSENGNIELKEQI